MTNQLYSQLAWLPPAPTDFSLRCRELSAGPELGKQAQRLANHALDENQLNRLAKVLRQARESGRSLAPLTAFRLGIVSNATSQPDRANPGCHLPRDMASRWNASKRSTTK